MGTTYYNQNKSVCRGIKQNIVLSRNMAWDYTDLPSMNK